ncbi:MAG: hypothetical protein HYZ91_06675 [Candidatus Omnitrophica bacterium]|nr:hypothetical protein [Candidatus Omnitrophota bacterium]
MRYLAIGLIGLCCVIGCASKKSSLLLERQARGPLDEEPMIARPVLWTLEPVMQTQAREGVEVAVNYASREYLRNLFSNRNLFGGYAGPSPYYPEYLVFYVKITNRSPQKIRLNPAEFTLVDDRGNQYGTVGVDYVTAFSEYRKPMTSSTRELLESASPGYFGVSIPLGRMIAKKPQGQFAQLQQSSLQPGYLFPGVVYDGLIAFWNPTPQAKKLRLLITNIKTAFDATDSPNTALEFPFDFAATAQE